MSSDMSTDTTGDVRRDPGTPSRWRTVDIVVASAIAVAFGVVFWAWGQLWNTVQPAFVAFPPAQAFMYGVWLLPAVLGALVIRKPGAAVYTELVAATVSALLGTVWGPVIVVYGLMQGAAAELVFAFLLYRSWRVSTAVVAGAAAGVAAALLDIVVYYPKWSGVWQLSYTALVSISAAVIAGAGGYLLMRALAQTGVLAPFRSGRDQVTV